VQVTTSAAEEFLAFPETRARQLRRGVDAAVALLGRIWSGRAVDPASAGAEDHRPVVQLRRCFVVLHIRHVVGHLRARGYQEPLRELTFATVGRRSTSSMPMAGDTESPRSPDRQLTVVLRGESCHLAAQVA